MKLLKDIVRIVGFLSMTMLAVTEFLKYHSSWRTKYVQDGVTDARVMKMGIAFYLSQKRLNMRIKTNAELQKYIGFEVEIRFWDEKVERGILGFTKEFSVKYGFRRPGYFTINNTDFKVSHIKLLSVLGVGKRLEL